MKALFNYDARLASGRTLTIAIAIFSTAFVFTHLAKFPGSLAYYMDVTQGQKIFDMAPSFSAAGVYERLEAMGEAGRTAYRQLIITIDFVFPVTVFFFLLAWTRFFIRKTMNQAQMLLLMKLFAVLPFVYFIFDMLENLMVLAVLSRYPARSAIAEFIGYFTVIKRGSMLIALFAPPLSWLGARIWRRSLQPA